MRSIVATTILINIIIISRAFCIMPNSNKIKNYLLFTLLLCFHFHNNNNAENEIVVVIIVSIINSMIDSC